MSFQIKKYIPNTIKRVIKLFFRNCLQSMNYYIIDGQILNRKQPSFSSVAFLCKGNVCRSPFAEVRFRQIGKNHIATVMSCGIDVDQGIAPPQDAIKVAAEYSCNLEEKRSVGLKECQLDSADLILVMEYGQFKELINMYPDKSKKIHILRSFAPFPDFLFCNIDDPYGCGEKAFRKTYKLINKSLSGLI